MADKSTISVSPQNGKYSPAWVEDIPAPGTGIKCRTSRLYGAPCKHPIASISRPSGRAFFNSREYSGVKPARSHPHHGLPLSFDGTVYFLMAKEIKGFTPEYWFVLSKAGPCHHVWRRERIPVFFSSHSRTFAWPRQNIPCASCSGVHWMPWNGTGKPQYNQWNRITALPAWMAFWCQQTSWVQ